MITMLTLKQAQTLAAQNLPTAMVGFPDPRPNDSLNRVFADVWICERLQRKPQGAPRFIFVLQDWGMDNSASLSSEIQALGDFIQNTAKPEPDPSIRKLLQCDHVRQRIQSGEIWVMNAVWGLRSSAHFPKKDGELPTALHRRAQPTWGKILNELVTLNSICHVFFLGGWAKGNTAAWDWGKTGRLDDYLRDEWQSTQELVSGSMTRCSMHYHPGARKVWMWPQACQEIQSIMAGYP